MQESYRTFQYELNVKLAQLLEEIDKIFKKAMQRRDTDAKSVEEDLKLLNGLLERVKGVRQQLS